MNLEQLKQDMLKKLTDESPQSVEAMINALKYDLMTHQLSKNLKETYKHIPKLASLADQIKVNSYQRTEHSYGGVSSAFNQFDLRTTKQGTFSFKWDLWTRPLSHNDELEYAFSVTQPNCSEAGLQGDSSAYGFRIDINEWKKLAKALDILDVRAIDFAHFLASICSFSTNFDKRASFFAEDYHSKTPWGNETGNLPLERLPEDISEEVWC